VETWRSAKQEKEEGEGEEGGEGEAALGGGEGAALHCSST